MIQKDITGVVGVHPLCSGDIRVVLKDNKAKERALAQGKAGDSRVLRQDFPVELIGVLKKVDITHGKEAEVKNRPFIASTLRENKHLSGITRVAWIHGDRSKTSQKARASLIIHFSTEKARDIAVQEGVIVQGQWHPTSVWSSALHTPRCFRCNQWGHTQISCMRRVQCGHCAGPHNTRDCQFQNKARCANCHMPHKAWDRPACKVYAKVKEAASNLRTMLIRETGRIQLGLTPRQLQEQFPLPQLQQPQRQTLPMRRVAGRPTDLSRVGSAPGQTVLTQVLQGDEMEL